MPHVFGRTDPDFGYDIAYAHAENGFRDVAGGDGDDLGALTGAGAKTDYDVHLLGMREAVDRDYDMQPADVPALLDGYASGLNLYSARHPEEARLARLFPLNDRDVAVGFIVRYPFFIEL